MTQENIARAFQDNASKQHLTRLVLRSFLEKHNRTGEAIEVEEDGTIQFPSEELRDLFTAWMNAN